MQFLRLFESLIEVFGDDIFDPQRGVGPVIAIESFKTFLMLPPKKADEAIHHFVGTRAVEARYPELGGSVRDQAEVGPRKKDRPCAANELPKGIKQRREQIHGAMRGALIGKLGR